MRLPVAHRPHCRCEIIKSIGAAVLAGAPHHRTGDKWCIYPMYDYAHPISDALGGITHSICTLEFEDHRPLYDWTIENLPLTYRPRQIEFARLNLTYTLMSKPKLLQLVEEKLVSGWNDPAHAGA